MYIKANLANVGMGYLDWIFILFLESKQESKLGFYFFRKQPCMPSRNATHLLSHVSCPYLKFQTRS
jgi:hypothetical protein